MKLELRVKALEKLGEILHSVGHDLTWSGFDTGITEEEYSALAELTKSVRIFNGWFTEKEVKKAFRAWGIQLKGENLRKWVVNYQFNDTLSNKTVGIIMAGNIPLVGFHDFVCAYLSGVKTKIKLSSDDDKLFPAVVNLMNHFDDSVKERNELITAQLKGIDAIIATGSNNTSRYFEQYFGKYPNIIRKSRTSVAILTGNETEKELKGLAEDVFAFYGLGCRNITKLFLPENYDLDKLFNVFFDYQYVANNNKYANNYDYHKAIFLMEQYDIIENGFLLMKQDTSLHSPIGTLYYDFYTDILTVKEHLKQAENEVQCVVSSENVPFGKAQKPDLWDYADNVDTLAFLIGLE